MTIGTKNMLGQAPSAPPWMLTRLAARFRSIDQNVMTSRIALVGLLTFTVGLAMIVSGLHGPSQIPLDGHGIPFGWDFVNTWFYGRAFFDGDPGRFYDHAVYSRAIEAILPDCLIDHIWSYPPPFLLVAAPFGLLPYVPALGLWTATGVLALGVTIRAHGANWMTVAAILVSPAVFSDVVAGQISLFCAVILLIALAQLDRRPLVAGLLVSLLIVKPQTAMLFPVLLAASGRWKVILAASAGVIAIVAVSVLATGIKPWIDFVTIGLPAQAADMRATVMILARSSTTMTTAATMIGLPPSLVTLAQALVTLFGVGLVAYVGYARHRLQPYTEPLVFLCCSAFATPYLLVHDLVALTAAVLIASCRYDLRAGHLWIVAIVFMPSLQGALSAADIPLAVFVPIGFALWLAFRPHATAGTRAEGRKDEGVGPTSVFEPRALSLNPPLL